MKEELRRQIDLEATENFLREQKIRQQEYEKEEAIKAERVMREYELEFQREKAREELRNEKERRIVQAKRTIKYSIQLVDEICRRVAGGEMLKAICEDKAMPTFQVVQGWFDEPLMKEFHDAYLNAVKLRDKAFEDEIVMIADDSSNDYVEKINSKTGETFRVLDPEALTRSKMRIDARLRIMKANNPARWGDNPNSGDATKELLKNVRPIVQLVFVEADKKLAQGDDAKVIEHRADDTPLATPYVPLDKDDLEYLRRRKEALQNKEKVA